MGFAFASPASLRALLASLLALTGLAFAIDELEGHLLSMCRELSSTADCVFVYVFHCFSTFVSLSV